MDSDAWNARYDQKELIWSAGPNQFVADHTRGLDPGRALDVACGEGRNAIWLAEQGWDVVGLDFSSVAIDKAGELAAHRGVTVDFRVADATELGDTDIGTPFDLVVIAYLHLGSPAIDEVVRRAIDLLAPGGTFLVVGHHVDNLDRGYGGPPDATVLYDPEQLAVAMAGLDVATAGEVTRTVSTDDGERTAIDALVIARRD